MFDSYFLDMMCVEFMKNFHLACWNMVMAVRLISASWAQKRLLRVFTHVLRRVQEKFSSCPFEQANGFYTHFGFLSAKAFDSYFLDMMYVDFMKNFLLADSWELLALRLISASCAQKTFDPYILDMIYVEFMKNFFSPIRASWWLLD